MDRERREGGGDPVALGPDIVLAEVVGEVAHAVLARAQAGRTGALCGLARAPSLGKSQDGVRNFRYYISQVYVWAESYLIAAAFTTLTFLVRLLVLVLTLPLILTAAFVGLIDGLVRRDVRRFGAGRESGFIYHRAKASLMPLAVLPWVTYLALPISVHPLVILLPSAALLGLAVSLTAGSFKKYL